LLQACVGVKHEQGGRGALVFAALKGYVRSVHQAEFVKDSAAKFLIVLVVVIC